MLQTVIRRRTVNARGLRLSLQYDNRITRYRWHSCSVKEPETLDWIDQQMGAQDILFDVGANIGIFSIYAAFRHPRLRVVALEPEYANLHLLRDNLIANRLHDRVEVYSVALGNRNGISQLHIQDFTPGAALHTESPTSLQITKTNQPVIGKEGIYALTLDAFCEQTGLVPNCLKIDVDGTEAEILEGAASTLRSSALRSLLVEMFGGPEVRRSCERLLSAAGLSRQWGDPSLGANEIWGRTA